MHRIVFLAVFLTASTAAADEPCKAVEQAIKAKDLTRASLLADGCDDADVAAKLDKALAKQKYARVEVMTTPEGGSAFVDVAEDLTFATPRTVWLAPGVHDITAVVDGTPVSRTTMRFAEDDRAAALLELPPPPDAPGTQELNFAEDGGPPEMTVGQPKDEKFKSLLSDKYLKGINAQGEAIVVPEPRGELWVGAGYTSRVMGVAVGVQPRYRVAGGFWALGVALDLNVVGGYEDAGYASFAGAGLATVAVGEKVRQAIGAGVGFAFASGEARDAGVVLHAETAYQRYSVVGRVEVPPFERISAAVMLGVRW